MKLIVNQKTLLYLPLILSILFFYAVDAKAIGTNTYIKSMDGVKEVPLSLLTNERSEGSLIYKAYKKESPLDVPRSRKKAHYFPIAGTSLDSIISYLQDGIMSYQSCNSDRLSKDLKRCELTDMKSLLDEDVKENRLQEAYPDLKKLVCQKSRIYQQMMLSVAAFDNDLNFLKYMMSKYDLEGKALLEIFSFNYEKELKGKALPLSSDDFRKYKLEPTEVSISQIVNAVDSKKKGILAYLLEQEVLTEDEILSLIRKVSRITSFQTGNEEVITRTGLVYRKIINNPILGKDAWLNVSSGVAWSSTAKEKMTLDDAIEYCGKKLVTDLSSGLRCHLPSNKEYQQIGIWGDKAYKAIAGIKNEILWASVDFSTYPAGTFIFAASTGLLFGQRPESYNQVRCMCTYEI